MFSPETLCFFTRTWKKEAPKAEGIASIALDQIALGPYTKFIRWKVHGDWVQQVSGSLWCVHIHQFL